MSLKKGNDVLKTRNKYYKYRNHVLKIRNIRTCIIIFTQHVY
jgi:hypothetical protein